MKKTKGSSSGKVPKYEDNRTAGTSEDMAVEGGNQRVLSYSSREKARIRTDFTTIGRQMVSDWVGNDFEQLFRTIDGPYGKFMK